MVLQAKVGTVDCPASTGNQAYTGVGFQPQALILFYSTRTGDGTSPNVAIGIGWATSSSQRFAWGFQSDDNVGTSAVRRAFSDALCVRLVTNDAATTGIAADLVSMDSDGFTLNWSIVTSGADIHYLALAGLTNAKAHGFTLPTGTGTWSRTGVGFQPTAALFLAADDTAAQAGGNDGRHNVSGCDGTTAFSFAVSCDDFASSAHDCHAFETGELLRVLNVVRTTDGTSDFVSFDADGFTLTTADAYVSAYLASALCLAGLSCKVGSLTVPGATGSQAVTGVGFLPKAVLFFAGHNALSSTLRNGFQATIGAASSSTARAVVSAANVEASDPLACDFDTDTTKCIKVLTAGTPTVDLAADLTSLDSDGFTLNWTTVGTGASTDQVVYVAFGSTAGAADARRQQPVLIG